MILETERLVIKPFSIELIHAAMTNDFELYQKIGVIPNIEWPDEDLTEALGFFQSSIQKHGVTGFGSWIITDKNNEIVGSAGFIGEPENGAVEIGFGIIPSKRRSGYCTEAVRALVKWARDQNRVDKIVARCNEDNDVSKRVLIKCDFNQTGIRDGLIEWECRN